MTRRIDHDAVCAAFDEGRTQREIAGQFGSHQAQICKILHANGRKLTREQRRARIARGARNRVREAQERKISSGEVKIFRDGEVLKYEAKGATFTFDPQDEELLRSYLWQVGDRRLLRQCGHRKTKLRCVYVYHDITGFTPDGVHVVDHINRDPTDNRRSNLRICTYSENALNIGSDINDGAANRDAGHS